MTTKEILNQLIQSTTEEIDKILRILPDELRNSELESDLIQTKALLNQEEMDSSSLKELAELFKGHDEILKNQKDFKIGIKVSLLAFQLEHLLSAFSKTMEEN